MKQMKQIHSILIISCLLLIAFFSACSSNKSEPPENNPGIVLNFDDDYVDTWERCFDLFDKYNAKVTFFIQGDSVIPFMLKAQERGHEIGYHTIHHPHLSQISREQFFEETVSSINVFRESGVDLTSFAYPYGDFEPWMHDELLKYYKTVRAYGMIKTKVYGLADMKSGVVFTKPLDNHHYKTDKKFQNDIDKALKVVKQSGKILPMTSHRISEDGVGITPQRLEYILEKAQEHGIPFYTFKDLQ